MMGRISNTGQRPQFVVIRGILPRSGTNYVADILRLHAHVTVNPNDMWEFAPLRFTPLWREYVTAIRNCKHAHGFHEARFEAHMGRAWIDYLSADVPETTTHLVVKEPSVDFLHEQHGMFPACRTIIVVRDARDLIASALRSEFVLPQVQWWRPQHWRRLLPLGDFRSLCRMYSQAGLKLLAFLKDRQDLVQVGQVRVVRYEDILARPRETETQLLDGLQLPADGYNWQALESLPVRGSSFLRNSDGEMNFQDGQPKTSEFRPVGRWADWSPARKRVFEAETGAILRNLDYDWDWTRADASEVAHRAPVHPGELPQTSRAALR